VTLRGAEHTGAGLTGAGMAAPGQESAGRMTQQEGAGRVTLCHQPREPGVGHKGVGAAALAALGLERVGRVTPQEGGGRLMQQAEAAVVPLPPQAESGGRVTPQEGVVAAGTGMRHPPRTTTNTDTMRTTVTATTRATIQASRNRRWINTGQRSMPPPPPQATPITTIQKLVTSLPPPPQATAATTVCTTLARSTLAAVLPRMTLHGLAASAAGEAVSGAGEVWP
jgi:hypothetical protein